MNSNQGHQLVKAKGALFRIPLGLDEVVEELHIICRVFGIMIAVMVIV